MMLDNAADAKGAIVEDLIYYVWVGERLDLQTPLNDIDLSVYQRRGVLRISDNKDFIEDLYKTHGGTLLDIRRVAKFKDAALITSTDLRFIKWAPHGSGNRSEYDLSTTANYSIFNDCAVARSKYNTITGAIYQTVIDRFGSYVTTAFSGFDDDTNNLIKVLK